MKPGATFLAFNFDPLSVQSFEKALGWWGSLVFFIFLLKRAKMPPEKVGDAWDEFEVAAWLGFTFLFQQSGYNFFCSSANTCGYRTDHQGLMRCLGFDDGQDGYGPEEDCLDGELLWPWP